MGVRMGAPRLGSVAAAAAIAEGEPAPVGASGLPRDSQAQETVAKSCEVLEEEEESGREAMRPAGKMLVCSSATSMQVNERD
jgi:hypothetical protein